MSERIGLPTFENEFVGDALLYLVVGVIFLATLPLVSRGLTMMHWLVARGVLGAWKSDALAKQVTSLESSRGAAISAEGHSLRRLERDIHDGPQQRLVRLQMDLAAAERQLDADPEKAKTLITEAMAQSKEALDELRALSRGFAPPILHGPRPGCRARVGRGAQHGDRAGRQRHPAGNRDPDTTSSATRTSSRPSRS